MLPDLSDLGCLSPFWATRVARLAKCVDFSVVQSYLPKSNPYKWPQEILFDVTFFHPSANPAAMVQGADDDTNCSDESRCRQYFMSIPVCMHPHRSPTHVWDISLNYFRSLQIIALVVQNIPVITLSKSERSLSAFHLGNSNIIFDNPLLSSYN